MSNLPSPFYRCPHCGHVILKDATFMKMVSAQVAVGSFGGGCPDCHQPLPAEKIYQTCEYDLSATQIAAGGYSADVYVNILKAASNGQVELPHADRLLLEEALKQAAPTAGSMKGSTSPTRRWVMLLMIIAILAATITLWMIRKVAPDGLNLPSAIRAAILKSAPQGSTFLSAQPVQVGGKEYWCLVTRSDSGSERWVASDPGSGTVMVIQGADQLNFSKLGCTNWEQAASGGVEHPSTPAFQTSPTDGINAEFSIPFYGLVLTYPTDRWQVGTDRASLEYITQPDCRIFYPASIYTSAEIPPNREPDRTALINGLNFEIYQYLNNGVAGAMYRLPEGFPGSLANGMPVVLYVEEKSETDPMLTCPFKAEEVFTTLRVP